MPAPEHTHSYTTLTDLPDLSQYATKTELDDMIAALPTPELPDVDLNNYYTKSETYTKTEIGDR